MPIERCGPEIVSPVTAMRPSYPDSSPPMMLNKVDLPQPDGPITARNSPGATVNDTLSSAVSAPSAV